MIALPIARWTIGDTALIWGVKVTTLLQFGAVAAVVLTVWGLARTAFILALVAIMTFLAEFVGSKTGLPFGHYYYTELLQPQLAGVPLLIPLAWFMMLPPAWAVAQILVGAQQRWRFAAVSAVALTAWDLFLDPQNVAWGLWVWTEGASQTVFSGGYFGIPWLNYAGWLLVAFLVTLVAHPPQVPVKPLLLIYGIVWLFQTIGQLFFWDLPGPGLVGFIGMGTMLLLVWRRRREVFE
jgi:putative membrane protein